jgi:hypothetical protein
METSASFEARSAPSSYPTSGLRREVEAVPRREETKRGGTGRRKSEHPDSTGEAGKLIL